MSHSKKDVEKEDIKGIEDACKYLKEDIYNIELELKKSVINKQRIRDLFEAVGKRGYYMKDDLSE